MTRSSVTAKCTAVLLAAGEATRMERPKQLLAWLGFPLVGYQIRQLLGSGIGQIIVVLGHQVEQVRPVVEEAGKGRVEIVVNRDYRTGKTSSIKAGLKTVASGQTCVLLQAADQPRSAQLIQLLVTQHLTNAAKISIPSHDGRHGHPPVFAKSLVPELLQITERGQGVREVIERHQDSIHEVAIDDPLVLTNLNTDEDYKRALSLVGKGLSNCHVRG